METLTTLMKEYPAVLVSNTFSPFCMAADALLKTLNMSEDKFKVVNVDELPDGEQLEKCSRTMSRKQELPHLYIGGTVYGRDLEDSRTEELEWALVKAGALDNSGKERLDKLLQSSVVIVGESFSPFTSGIVQYFDVYEIEKAAEKFSVCMIDEVEDGDQIAKAAKYLAKAYQLPLCFIGGKFIGSTKEVETLHNKEELESLLVDAGALSQPSSSLLNDLVSTNQVLLLTNAYSAYCLKVDAILSEFDLIPGTLKKIDLDSEENGEELERAARFLTKETSPPYIFLSGKHKKMSDFFDLCTDKLIENTLIDVGALPKPNMTKLDSLLEAKGVLLLTNSFSPFCLETEHILEGYSKDKLKIVDIGTDKNDELSYAARYMTQQVDPPYVFIDGKHIGGNAQVATLHKNGNLKSMFKRATLAKA